MKSNQTHRLWSVGWLYAGFALTGLGTALLGCILPTLIVFWGMNDARAGLLFAAQFAGTALGAGLVGHNYYNSVVRGYLLLIAGAFAISYFGHSPHVALFFIFGLGLGLTMTATQMFTSTLYPNNRGAVLSVLNACWSFGAFVCPVVASVWTARLPPQMLYFVLAAAAGTLFLLAKRINADLNKQADGAAVRNARSPVHLIASFALVAFLYVGVEASVSGWMMAYVRRLTVAHSAWPPIAVSCFWIALLCGRVIAPAVLRRISEASLLTASLLGAFASVLWLILNRSAFGIVLSAGTSGLALGPVFPLCTARVFALAHDSPKTKWILGSSGLGGALLPWLTGELSAHQGSLGVGLTVPLAALAIMLVLQLLATRSPTVTAYKELAVR